MDSACESIFPSAVVTRVVRFVIAVEFAVIFPFAVDRSLVSWVMALPCAVNRAYRQIHIGFTIPLEGHQLPVYVFNF